MHGERVVEGLESVFLTNSSHDCYTPTTLTFISSGVEATVYIDPLMRLIESLANVTLGNPHPLFPAHGRNS